MRIHAATMVVIMLFALYHRQAWNVHIVAKPLDIRTPGWCCTASAFPGVCTDIVDEEANDDDEDKWCSQPNDIIVMCNK